MGTPYVGFSSETLTAAPRLKAGDSIECPKCGRPHEVQDSTPPRLLFYRCGEATYLAGIDGKSTMSKPPDVSGKVDL